MLPAMSGLSREQRLLQCFRVPTTDNVYILGCFERRVTIHSQQIRAFNLIHSLYTTSHQSNQTPHIVIVGAGIAGLTAAYAALKKRARVTLLEQHAQPLALLQGCLTRWIHPNIYDWPDPLSTNPTTNLPAFNWRADYAGEVAKALLKDWNDLVKQPYRDYLTTHYSASPIQPDTKTSSISFTVIDDHKQVRTERIKYDVLILAVGFGIEKSVKDHSTLSYWRNDDLAQIPPKFTAHQPAEILVSGVGDGGLTDVMRLRLTNFEHQDFLTEFIEDDNLSDLARTLSHLEQDIHTMEPQRASLFIHEEYNKLILPNSALKKIELRLRGDTKVTLNGTLSTVFQKDSSILNRLITLILLKKGDLRYFQGKIKSIKPVRRHRSKVTFESMDSRIFDRIIVRHGTDSSIEEFRTIYSLCTSLKTMAALDETRTPLWNDDSFDEVPRLYRSSQLANVHSKFDAWIKLLNTQSANPLLVLLRSLIPDSTVQERFEQSSLADIPFGAVNEDEFSQWDYPRWPHAVIDRLGMLIDAQRIVSLLNVAECLVLTALPFIIQEIRKTGLLLEITPEIMKEFEDCLIEFPQIIDRCSVLLESKNASDIAMLQVLRAWIRFRFASRIRGLITRTQVEEITNKALNHQAVVWPKLGWDVISLLCRIPFLSERDIDSFRVQNIEIAGVNYPINLSLIAALLYLAENSVLTPGNLTVSLILHIETLGSSIFAGAIEQILSARVRYDVPNKCMIVEAKCSDPYVDHALTEYAEELNKKLNIIGSKLTYLLPSYFHMPQLAYARIAARFKDNKEAYIKPLINFSMDTNSIRKLLMGSQLWKDSTLAIREIYQNAVDACRYRKCRAEFEALPYLARIIFIEGKDSKGRKFIECIDNGIGMDVDVLQRNFSKAGQRFADTADYLREREAWRTKEIKLSPVSKFGIGVFSYYLIADEIEIETCRLSLDGKRTENRIYVNIPTSDSLFRVSPAVADVNDQMPHVQNFIDEWRKSSGTRIRLYIRPTISLPMETRHREDASLLLDSLKRFVGLPETEMVVFINNKVTSWSPAVLNLPAEAYLSLSKHCWMTLRAVPDATHAEQPILRSYRGRAISEHYDRYKNYRIHNKGWLLIDGITTLHRLPGIIINLTGDNKPQLAVDRVEVQDTNSYSLSLTLTHILSDSFAEWTLKENPISADWLTGIWLAFPRELTQLLKHFEQLSQRWSNATPTNYFDTWIGPANERKYFPLDEAELRRICLDKDSKTKHADLLLQLCRAVYWDRTTPIREKRERDSWPNYDGAWIEELKFNYIDQRILAAWKTYHAGPIEAALLYYLKYEKTFKESSSAVLYASWLTGQSIGACAMRALQLGDVLELGSHKAWKGLAENSYVVEDRDAWMLSHCGVNAGPNWVEEKFTLHSILVIARNRGESLKQVVPELEELSGKISESFWNKSLSETDRWEEFLDNELLRALPYGVDVADNGLDFLFTCSVIGDIEAIAAGKIPCERALKYVAALGFSSPAWSIDQFRLLAKLSQEDIILLSSAHGQQFPRKFSNGSLLDLASAHYLLERPVKDCLMRANELREQLQLPKYSFNEDPESAIEKLTPQDYKLLTEKGDGRSPFRKGPFSELDLLRCWLSFGDVVALGRRLMHISSVLGWNVPAWNLEAWQRLESKSGDRGLFAGRYEYLTHYLEIEPPTIGKLLLLAAQTGTPLWRLEERLNQINALTDIARLDNETTYCGITWRDLVEESRRLT